MPRARLPQAKAEASAATIKNPARFKDRKAPKSTRPLGEPYATMTEVERGCWADFARDLPWLHAGHRVVLRMACVLAARLESGSEMGVQAMMALSSILSKLGATPADETKVNHDPGEPEDPDDRFFTRPH